MRIVSDRNIPFVREVFSELGEVVVLPADAIDSAAVRDADVLLCRTTLSVGPALLEGSRVRFVATATIGIDHFDLPYLAQRQIACASAPGSNADSVALWWAAALANFFSRTRRDLRQLRVGIIGVGHVGARVAKMVRALGGEALLYDPPRARKEGQRDFCELDDILPKVDVLSLHVPLSDEKGDATRGFIDAARLKSLRPGALLINSCRGEVVDGEALFDALVQQRIHALLDVFPSEPSPNPQLIAKAALATPHIAGHSLDGKVNGTDAVYRATCAFLGCAPTVNVRDYLPSIATAPQILCGPYASEAELIEAALRPYYDITTDDAALRRIAELPSAERAQSFRAYRDHYPGRREPRGVPVKLPPHRERVFALLACLGFVSAVDA